MYLLSIPYFIWLLLLEYAHDGGAGGMLGRGLRKVRGFFEAMALRWHGVRKTRDGSSLMLADGLQSSTGTDEDVEEERQFVVENKNTLQQEASVVLVNMWKVYPPSVGMFGSLVSWIKGIISFICCCGCFRRRTAAARDDEEEDTSSMPKRAVRGVTTAVTRGETYGLLGVSFGTVLIRGSDSLD